MNAQHDPREPSNLAHKLARISEPWKPRILAQLNGQHVKLAKLEGAFEWHRHEAEDELFLVLEGRLAMHYRDRVVELDVGELCVVPRGVEHCPVAQPRASVLLFEPVTTLNTGDGAESERTLRELEWI